MIIEARRPSKCVNADEIVNRQNNPLNKWVLQPNISFTFPKSAKIGKNKILENQSQECYFVDTITIESLIKNYQINPSLVTFL